MEDENREKERGERERGKRVEKAGVFNAMSQRDVHLCKLL